MPAVLSRSIRYASAPLPPSTMPCYAMSCSATILCSYFYPSVYLYAMSTLAATAHHRLSECHNETRFSCIRSPMSLHRPASALTLFITEALTARSPFRIVLGFFLSFLASGPASADGLQVTVTGYMRSVTKKSRRCLPVRQNQE